MNTYFSKIFITIGIAYMTFANPVSANESEPMPKRVIVQVKGTETGDLNGEVISSKQNQRQTTLTLEVPKGISTEAFIKELKEEENVLRVEEDHLLTPTYTPNDFFYPYQSHHNNIRSSEAWERSRGANVTVAILDTGIDLSHEDLKDKIVNPYDVVYDSPYTLTAGEHGTHVAGIVGSQMDNYYGGVGVAPDAAIMPIDVFAGTSAYTSDVIEGVYRAVDQGADIINMSLGNYYYNYSFQQAIDYAYANDVLVVAAAGNDATNATHYPSSYNYVISVGSTTSYDTLSYFSNYGWNIDVTAPGSSIYSSTPYSSYGYMSGTSMASPVVAGVAALVKSNEPGLSVDAITERLTSTADDLGSTGWDYYYGSGRVNAKEALRIRELEAVTLNEFSDASDTITGTVPSGNGYGSVVIYDGWGNEVGSANDLSGGDTFSIPTSRYPAGTMMRALFYDYIGNYSPFASFTVTDRTAPSQPTVLEMSDQLDYLVGQTEANAYVRVEQPNRGTVVTGYADESGSFMFYTGRLLAGTTLRVTATDASGNQSETTTLDVLDRTAPSAPQINELSDRSTAITGKAEAKSTVIIKVGQTEKWRTIVDDEGTFSIAIDRLTAGTSFEVTVVDIAGNISPVTKLTVLDRTAPDRPSVNEVTDAATKVTGKAEKGAKVVLTKNNQPMTHSFADGSGDFTLTIEKQLAGTILTIVVEDAAGNKSLPIVKTVVDKTAPAKPSVNAVSDAADTVTGKAEAESKVTVKSSTTLLGQATVKSDGTYAVTVGKQKAGTRLSVTSTDAAGNVSQVVETTVVDQTAPIKPNVDLVSDADEVISGQAETGSVVAVKVGTVLLGKVTTGTDGTFSMAITKQKAGTVLTLTSTDAAGNVSPSLETTVVDKTSPAIPTMNVVSDATDTVTGKAEAGSIVKVKSGTVLLGQVTTNADGIYAVTIGKQKAGTRLSVTSTDAAGNVSPVVETTVIDKTAPVTPTVVEVTDQTVELNGTAEAETTLTVKVNSTQVAKGTVAKDGTFRIAIPKQAVATRLSITSTDAAGNISPIVMVTVLDRTAPAIPRVDEVSDQTTVISGTAEPKAVIHVKNGTLEIGKGVVQTDGTFRVSIGKQPSNAVLLVTVVDESGNMSQSVSVLVADKSAPVLQVNQITNQTVTIQGTTEARSVVEMTYMQQSTRVTSDVNGRFSFTIKVPKTGERFSFIAIDVAGNKGDVLNLSVTDVTKPVLSGVSSLTLEAGQSFNLKQGVTAVDETDGNVTSSIIVSGSVDVKKPGVYALTYTVKDRAGNESKAVRQITVKDTVKPVLSGVKTTTVYWNAAFDARKGITAKDNISGDLTTVIKVSGKVDVKRVGTYALTYSVTDRSGNTTTAVRKVVVKDHVKPVISGAKSKTIKLKSSFKPLTGVTAIDNVDGVLTRSIKVTGIVNTKRKGIYVLTYTVKDQAGNSSVVNVKITVK